MNVQDFHRLVQVLGGLMHPLGMSKIIPRICLCVPVDFVWRVQFLALTVVYAYAFLAWPGSHIYLAEERRNK